MLRQQHKEARQLPLDVRVGAAGGNVGEEHDLSGVVLCHRGEPDERALPLLRHAPPLHDVPPHDVPPPHALRDQHWYDELLPQVRERGRSILLLTMANVFEACITLQRVNQLPEPDVQDARHSKDRGERR
eukprot:762914-Hanusia_phi.AAC.6